MGPGEERRGQNLEGGRSDLQVSFPDVLNEIKARVNYRKNLPKGTEYTIEKGSIARGEGRKLTRRPPQFYIQLVFQSTLSFTAKCVRDRSMFS